MIQQFSTLVYCWNVQMQHAPFKSCSPPHQQARLRMDEDETRAYQARPDPQRACLWNLYIALLKSINWMRTLLRALVMWHLLSHKTRLRKKRTVTEVRTGRGERNLPPTVSLTFWWATGARDDQWERERQWQRGRETDRQISVVPLRADLDLLCLVTATSVLLINLSWVYSLTHTHTHAHSKSHKHTPAHQHTASKHPQIIYLLFCYFGGLLALRTLWRLLERQQGMERLLTSAHTCAGARVTPQK